MNADAVSPEQAVLTRLRETGKTFAAAESCTGGLAAKRITDLPGASAVFRGGVVVYTNAVKELLGVRHATLEAHTAVSREVAAELAECVRERLGADYGVGVTGVAGPDTDGVHPVGTVFVSVSDGVHTTVRALRLPESASRAAIRSQSADALFSLLLERL